MLSSLSTRCDRGPVALRRGQCQDPLELSFLPDIAIAIINFGIEMLLVGTPRCGVRSVQRADPTILEMNSGKRYKSASLRFDSDISADVIIREEARAEV